MCRPRLKVSWICYWASCQAQFGLGSGLGPGAPMMPSGPEGAATFLAFFFPSLPLGRACL